MSPLITLLNHLLAGLLREGGAEGSAARGVSVRAVVLDDAGGRLVATLASGSWQGEAILRLEADPASDAQGVLRLRIEQLPEGMPAALDPFRKLLLGARLTLELDFTP